MTFNANIPNPSETPFNITTQAPTNFSRLKTLFNADHVFNDTAAVDDGAHRKLSMVNVDTADRPAALPAGINQYIYSYLVPTTGTKPIVEGYDGTSRYYYPKVLASAKFTSMSNPAPTIVGNSYNVASIVRASAGDYTITFTTALPSVNGGWNFQVQGTTAFSYKIPSYTTASIQVQIINTGSSGSPGVDPTALYFEMYWGG